MSLRYSSPKQILWFYGIVRKKDFRYILMRCNYYYYSQNKVQKKFKTFFCNKQMNEDLFLSDWDWNRIWNLQKDFPFISIHLFVNLFHSFVCQSFPFVCLSIFSICLFVNLLHRISSEWLQMKIKNLILHWVNFKTWQKDFLRWK